MRGCKGDLCRKGKDVSAKKDELIKCQTSRPSEAASAGGEKVFSVFAKGEKLLYDISSDRGDSEKSYRVACNRDQSVAEVPVAICESGNRRAFKATRIELSFSMHGLVLLIVTRLQPFMCP